MIMVELRYECITRSFLIDECRITEFFSSYIVNFTKQVPSTSPDLMLVDEKLSVCKSILEESILNIVADGPESRTRAIAPRVNMSHQTVYTVLNENRLHYFYFQRVQALNPADYLLQLPVGGTKRYAGFRSSCAEQLL
ncbi:hypothetical protein TNCV_3550301 [Trichonephila clavipes]|nr:hypothetical protein TNCV_3550301 [Trichonephila clavipes]